MLIFPPVNLFMQLLFSETYLFFQWPLPSRLCEQA